MVAVLVVYVDVRDAGYGSKLLTRDCILLLIPLYALLSPSNI